MSAPVLLVGDCVERMREMDDCSVDAIATDPPYGLEFMGKDWDGADGFRRSLNESDVGRANIFGRTSRTSPEYRALHLFQEWCEVWGAEALRVLKPGGHLLAFGGTRTYHRLASALEDAGFEIRDTLCWMYGSGFPKSLDVSKAIDVAAGAEREVVRRRTDGPSSWMLPQKIEHRENGGTGIGYADGSGKEYDVTAPATEDAKTWQGWGTALKPAFEPIVLARKPLTGTVAANVLAHGTGALNIDGCRIGRQDGDRTEYGRGRTLDHHGTVAMGQWAEVTAYEPHGLGRWPANVVLDEEAAAMLDEQTGVMKDGTAVGGLHSASGSNAIYARMTKIPDAGDQGYGGEGGASRFFYCAKVSQPERNAGLTTFPELPSLKWDPTSAIARDGRRGAGVAQNNHPTVKPISLMRWLIRLITPPGGTLLDPFLGSGSTGCAAVLENVQFIGIERDPDYMKIAEARMAFWLEHGDDALKIVAMRERAENERAAKRDAGQIDIFSAF